MDMVRAGITLYGMWPSEDVDKTAISLKPALSLVTHVAYVKELPAGRAISYGGTYVTKEPRMIATIPCTDSWPCLYGSVYGRCHRYSGC